MKEVLVTGFGPFGKFRDNPSDILATRLTNVESEILPVTFEAADRFARRRLPSQFGAVVMLGVAEGGHRFRLERRARNWVGDKPDVFDATRGPAKISPHGNEYLYGTLFDGWEETDAWTFSEDAGSYLCNYLYYKVLERNPEARCGFVHVLPFSVAPLPAQLGWLEALIEKVRETL